MRVKVTGSQGFIGQHLLEHLSEHELVPWAGDADVVIHAGARVGRERCEADKGQAVARNVTGTLWVAEECSARGKSLLYVSSAEAAKPSNLYGLTKHWAEEACRLALPSEQLTIARLGVQYGPGARLGADTLSNFLQAAMRDEELRVYRDTWRTWTYVEDTARALVLIAEQAERWREHGKHLSEPALYDVDSGDRHALVEVAEMVVALVGGGRIVEVTTPAGYSALPLADTRRLRSLGWEPQFTFEQGLALTYAGLRESLLAAA